MPEHAARRPLEVVFRHEAAGRAGRLGVALGTDYNILLLASSFGTLAIYHDQGTKLAMATGILIASFVVSSLLVPSIAALVGRRAWWPGDRGRLTRVPAPAAEAPEPLPIMRG
jgi:uncharacterized membrane protein YdfJ with MMPL/SSD domain